MKLRVFVIAQESTYDEAVETAWSARPLGAPTFLVVPTTMPFWVPPTGAQVLVSDDFDAQQFHRYVDPVSAGLFLNAGEMLESTDWVGVRKSIEKLKPGTPGLVAVGGNLQQRLLVRSRIQSASLLSGLRIGDAQPVEDELSFPLRPLHN